MTLLLISIGLRAQERWQSKGTLYSDKNIAVEIEYLISPVGCEEGGSLSYFRYKITRLGAIRDYYINWRFDFFNCNNELKTQLNSLHIVRQTKLGVSVPERNSFAGKKMSNYFNDVRRSSGLPEIGSYKPVSVLSMEPIAITGIKDINSGEPTTLGLVGGSLGTGASWMWYEGSCEGKLLGSGATLTISPLRTTNVFVRAVGQKNTPCIYAEVRVKQGSIAPTAILGRNEICEGERNITLSVSGGKLVAQAKWVWYAGSCAGERLGEGAFIQVSPVKTTTYFVRAENGDDITMCQSLLVSVKSRSTNPDAIEGPQIVNYGGGSNLKIVGGYLAPGAKWVWYKGSGANMKAVGNGTVFATGPLYQKEVFSIRAEGGCSQTSFISRSISVVNGSHQVLAGKNKGKSSLILNGGVNFTEITNIEKTDNYMISVGYGGRLGGFVRAKLSGKNTSASFQTDDVSVMNYNFPGYYEYNGQIVDKRSGYTAGMFFGGHMLSGYLAGGYGSRELLWGIDQYDYGSGGFHYSGYAKHIGSSFKGAELEVGVMLRLGFINIMGGASNIKFKYTDFNLGIGINL